LSIEKSDGRSRNPLCFEVDEDKEATQQNIGEANAVLSITELPR